MAVTYLYKKQLHEGLFKHKEPNTQFGAIQDTSIIPEEITYKKPITRGQINISSKNIRVTTHAKENAYKRLGIASEREIQKIAASAKRNGLCINNLSMFNYDSFELTLEQYKWLKDKVYYQQNEIVYFYKGYFFIFMGKHNRSLKTIIYPGLPISAEKPSTGDDIIDAFFADIHETQFHNINNHNSKGRMARNVRHKF